MKLRDLFCEKPSYSDRYELRIWAFITLVLLGGAAVATPVSFFVGRRSAERYEQRFQGCMADKHDKYFCESWAIGRVVVSP